MSTQSVANNPSGPTRSQIPAIRSFEFDDNAIGSIKSSVNCFRGSVSLPVDFLTLPGRQGLDVKVSAIYSSSIKNRVSTWNVEAPTGILGLGWEMPIELITVFKAGSGSSTSDTYYLIAGGVANPMVKTGEVDGLWQFQLRNYEFWEISYDPAKNVWTIVRENGFTYTYGGTDPDIQAIQWGVKWGNWIGSSSERAGQEQYPVAWNLASIESPWGHRVAYTYHNVNRSVGADGLEFTQASYIKTVTDSYGRTITFNYAEKFGALNPSPRGIVEYQALHSQRPEPNAYQDKYETLYLDSIDTANAEGEPLLTLKFNYDLINVMPTGDPNYPLLWKRCLRSVHQQSPGGATLPGMRFEYGGPDDLHPGALTSILYPTGGTARFCYKKVVINAPKRITVSNPWPGSTPRVWHGNDYVVLTYCRPEGGLKVLVYSWDGRWVDQDITDGAMPSIQADPDSVLVSAQADTIALSFRNLAASRDELYLYRKDRSEFGKWLLYNDQPFYLNLKAPDAAPSTFVTGTDFVIAYNKEYAGGLFQGFSYGWQHGDWTPPPLIPSSSDAANASGVALAALQNYYIVAFYFKDKRRAEYQIFYRDLEGQWHESGKWASNDLDVTVAEDGLLFTWSPQPTSAVATYITGSTADKVKYSLRIFQWAEDFTVLNPDHPAVVDLETPVTSGKPQYEVFRTIATGPFVNNNLANLRNIGGDLRYGSSINWLQKSFPTPAATSSVAFASGEDVAVMCENVQGRQNNQLLVFDPNYATAGWSFDPVTQDGQYPTVSGNHLTVGRTIYLRSSKGRWNPLQIELFNLGDQKSVQNRSPNYIAYQDSSGSGARSYVVTLKNGQASTPQELAGGPQKVYVPQEEAGWGTSLAGVRFLVSYPSSSPSFKEADRFFLCNLDEADLGDSAFDYAVAYVEIENAYDPSQSFYQSFFYANSEQSQIAYNSATGVTQYPLVTVAPGVKSTAESPPTDQPQGRSEHYYSNGLSPQDSLRYPQGWIYNYQNTLNGMLLSRKDYTSDNRLVSSLLNYWQVYHYDVVASQQLYGGYVRLVRTTTETDGVVQDTTAEYDEAKGVELWREQTYFDANGDAKKLRAETRYAWQVPEYAAAFLRQHIYTAVVQDTKSVVGQDPDRRNYVESRATTYRNWAESTPTIECSDPQRCRLAPYQDYVWTSPGEDPPDFFSGDRSDWLLASEIVRRSDPEGVIEEQRDVNGVPSSFLYDRYQRYLIARFPNGSLEGDEVSYVGFEDYESDQDWVLGPGAAIVPDPQHPEVDAHTGTRSLRLAPSTLGTDGVVRTFRPGRQDQAYIFSAWVKKPCDFDADQGNARWQISIAGEQALTLEFPDAVGQWAYVSQVIDLPASPDASGEVEIEIRGENTNPASHVLVDDLRFSPFRCLFEATGYDTRFWLPSALLGANGECNRTVFDAFQQPILYTNRADLVSKIAVSYFSRQGHEGSFSTTDPNHSVNLRPATGGDLYTFTRGSEWQRLWRAEPDVWEVVDGRLTQQGPQMAGTLSIDDPRYGSDYALAVDFETREAVTQPLGLHLGQALTVCWNPQTLEWQLLDGSGDPAAPPVDPRLFAVPADPYASELDAGRISTELCDQFGQAGYPLPPDSSVTPGAASGKSWTLTSPDLRYRYDLRQQDQAIGVYRVATNWVALVGAQSLVFWADGQLIFSHQARQPFTAAPTLFFGSQVAISQLTTACSPQADATFRDSRGYPKQLHALVDDRLVVSQTITDDAGREAVRTKPAFVEPATSPLFVYCSDFANLDWDTGKMSGLVSAAYPEDGGYPYYREVYEASALARVIERGMPGELFRIGAHSTHIAYTGVGGQAGDAPAQFYKTTTTNPNGDVYFEVRTLLDQVISKVSIKGQSEVKSATSFDDAGNPVELRSPNYHNPPAGSQPSDWSVVQTFDYAGRLQSSQSGKEAPSRFIYDQAGNMRFALDPQGAKASTFNYVKYDVLNRPIESGYVSGAWNGEELQDYADTDPTWPSTPPTWRKKHSYDGDQQVRYSIGRVHQMLSNNTDDGQADVTERLSYDVMGNQIAQSLAVDPFDAGQEHVVDYQYNNAGNITQITYPAATGGDRLQVYYRNNRLDQVTAIAELPDFSAPLATFTYRADGQLLEEALGLDSGQSVRRCFEYNSPLWVTTIREQNQAGATLFDEALSYTEGGYDDAGYYDGTIAAASYQPAPGASNPYQFRYSYDSVGQIENAQNTSYPGWDLGVAKPVDYDPNGNFQTLTRGGVARQYEYVPGTQRVQAVSNPVDGSVLARYEYDDNGNAIQCSTVPSEFSAAHDLTIEYDPGTKMTTRITDAAAEGATLSFHYGGQNQRVLKEVQQGGESPERKLYVRGISAYPLVELTTGGATTPVLYVYGPGGLVAMRRNGTTYGLVKDHLGSVRAVLDPQAQVVASYDYLTFGALAMVNEPEPGFMPYLFTGQEYDWEVGLYNYRARFYSGELGRFIAIDPERQFFSPYIYTSNNPVLYIDPTGSLALWARILLGIALVAVGVVVGIVGTVVAGPAGTAAGVGIMNAAFALEVSASTAMAVANVALVANVATTIAVGAAFGAAAGAALGTGMYSLTSSQESFTWSGFGQAAALGAIGGAISGGVATAASIGAQAVATAVTGTTQWGAQAGAQAAGLLSKPFAQFVARSAVVSAVSSSLAGMASTGVTNAVSNIWGLENFDPSDMALSIFAAGGMGLLKGTGTGALGASWSGKLSGMWEKLPAAKYPIAGAGGLVAAGGVYAYFYNREQTR